MHLRGAEIGQETVNDVDLMELALEEARLAEEGCEVPIGAVLVNGDVILSCGANRTIRDCGPTAHAEMVALREAARIHGAASLIGTTFYITLEPCAMCAGAMIHAGVSRLVYGADDPKGGRFALVSTCLRIPNWITQSKLCLEFCVTKARLFCAHFSRRAGE